MAVTTRGERSEAGFNSPLVIYSVEEDRLKGVQKTTIAMTASIIPSSLAETSLPLGFDLHPNDAWNATQRDYPRDRCVPQLVAAQAGVKPDSPAVSAGGQMLTYRQLDEQANQLAHHLIALGVKRETIVGLCMDRSPEAVVCALAVLKAGGAYLPLDPAYPVERLAFILNEAQPRVLIAQQILAEQLSVGSWKVVDIDSDRSKFDCQSIAAPTVEVNPTQLAYVIYTSGSTGQPKGVEITHHSLLNLVFWHRREFEVTQRDKASVLASVGFDAAVWEIWPYLTAGASLHLPSDETRVSPARLRDWLVTEEISISFLPTALAERVSDDSGVAKANGAALFVDRRGYPVSLSAGRAAFPVGQQLWANRVHRSGYLRTGSARE